MSGLVPKSTFPAEHCNLTKPPFSYTRFLFTVIRGGSGLEARVASNPGGSGDETKATEG